ncbi:hypothetical protein OsJ_19256 [Oryza sativa Japonica Group]|uniref:DUF3615 domain-containing protein n=1 Tax=Oryza sativa subsp. japonica TaxID=39947 RepID=B9FL78_ORYSJ|nr:hypothetical protein OsJ_19256 [Oryza sativa Japonica Group]
MVGGGVRDGDEEAALWPRPIMLEEDYYSRRRRAREHDRRRAAALREEESNERLARECLDHYNALHPGDEHDLAPGDVTLCSAPCNSTTWTHGNFVARRRSGCLASLFLPSRPRTLFFFEHMSSKDFLGVVTCVPMADEPDGGGLLARVPLCRRWATRRRRSGRWDCVCRTCNRGLHVKHPWLKKKVVGEFPCGHLEAASVCKMCFSYSDVVHPSPGKFARGYREHEDDFWRPCNGCKM